MGHSSGDDRPREDRDRRSDVRPRRSAQVGPTAPQDPDGTPDNTRGIVEIVAGTGGAELEAFKDTRPNSLVRINDAYGVLELRLLAGSWSFTSAAGAGRRT